MVAEIKESFTERLRWWLHYPRFELIYLLGGIPNQHNGSVVHYRNIRTIFEQINKKIAAANPPI